jgi:hypothetical protein
MSDRFVSSGHGDRYEVTVWGNPAAVAGLDAGTPWPEGAVLAEQATSREGRGDAPAGWLVMRRTASGWSFTAVGPSGETATDAGVEACGACHRDAPDGVFRWTAVR